LAAVTRGEKRNEAMELIEMACKKHRDDCQKVSAG
jgi:hypothetical protein